MVNEISGMEELQVTMYFVVLTLYFFNFFFCVVWTSEYIFML
jgi:hypothetical protein